MTIIPTHRLLAQPVQVIERRPDGSIVQFMDGSRCARPIPDQDMVAIHAPEANGWRETVRDIYDTLHFGEDNIYTKNRLAGRIAALIEARHPDFFNAAEEPDPDRLRDDRDERRRLAKGYPDNDE